MSSNAIFGPLYARLTAFNEGRYLTDYDFSEFDIGSHGGVLNQIIDKSYQIPRIEALSEINSLLTKLEDTLTDEKFNKNVKTLNSYHNHTRDTELDNYELRRSYKTLKERLLSLQEDISSLMIDSEIKFKLNIRTTSFAYLIGLMDRVGIINVPVRTVMSNFLSNHFLTMSGSKPLSSKAVYNSYIFPSNDMKDPAITRESLENMLDLLEKDLQSKK